MTNPWSNVAAATVLALGIALSTLPSASAAIPCIDQPVIDSAVDYAIAAPVMSDPFTIETVMAGPHTDLPSTLAAFENPTTPATDESLRDEVAGPIENIVRCVVYGDVGALATLATGRYRAEHMAMPSPDDVRHSIAAVDGFRLLNVTGAARPDANHIAGRAEILLDHDRLLIVTLVFQRTGDYWYLSDSAVRFAGDVDEAATISLTARGATPTSVSFPAAGITAIGIDNQQDSIIEYTLRSVDDGRTLDTGIVVPAGFAGPPDDAVLVLHHLSPGAYELRLKPGDALLPLHQIVEITLT